MSSSFADMLAAGYGFTDPAVTLGAALEKGGAVAKRIIRAPQTSRGNTEGGSRS